VIDEKRGDETASDETSDETRRAGRAPPVVSKKSIDYFGRGAKKRT
jgi:hypothetical protein